MIRTYSTWTVIFCFFLLFTACDNDDDEMPNTGAVAITADATEYRESRGNTVNMNLSLQAEAGIASLGVSIDGGTNQDIPVTAGATDEDVTVTFDIPGVTQLGTEFEFEFVLTDQDGATGNLDAKVVTEASISTPNIYAFERNGETTVSYSGQTERLNMVAEIKSKILAEADKGNVITEQSLLDAFENTDGNGAGLFSFTSTKQLKNKTFAPDLDANLFENFFAEAATASEDANAGAIASNGVAGLITRENSGKTILLDKNGREFTQLIEKGLMGAVFYNQIYNVYLTDARIGDEVENVALRDGKNYTDMEHHWDEAFGYVEAPVDFSSPWPDAREPELRFWANYSNVVDNVANNLLGTNQIIIDALIEGRAAIVNQDFAGRDAAKATLAENLELVAAATTVHYINVTLGYLNEGKTGEAFHTLSEAWAFANALKYSPDRKIDLATLEQIMEQDYGADGNFWNVTSDGLNAAKATLVSIYPAMEPVKDDL